MTLSAKSAFLNCIDTRQRSTVHALAWLLCYTCRVPRLAFSAGIGWAQRLSSPQASLKAQSRCFGTPAAQLWAVTVLSESLLVCWRATTSWSFISGAKHLHSEERERSVIAVRKEKGAT